MQIALILIILAVLPLGGQESFAQDIDFPYIRQRLGKPAADLWESLPEEMTGPGKTERRDPFVDGYMNNQGHGRHDAGEAVSAEWVRRYDGPAHYHDGAQALAVDGQGNVYVTGHAFGPGGWGYATIKYNAAGNRLWVKRYTGPAEDHQDRATALAVDGQGNVYVTGLSYSDETELDYATIKYDAAGNRLWVRRYNGPADEDDVAQAIAVDSQGNVYVTGRSYGSDDIRYDYATIKYDTDGNRQWVRRYNGPGRFVDCPTALAVDDQGNVYITGRSYGSDDILYDYATIKYDTDGNRLWVKRYNGPGNGSDWAMALALDSQGNVYVTGLSYGAGTNLDYATIKYDPAGNEQWVQRYNGPGNGLDWATALAVDGLGNIYVTGLSYGAGTNLDYATIKYDAAGNKQWVQRYNGPGNREDMALALALDGQGNVYVSGSSMGNTGIGDDYATIKYDAAGNEQWVQRYNGPGNRYDWATALAVDGQGHVYVTGSSYGGPTNHDFATIKYGQE